MFARHLQYIEMEKETCVRCGKETAYDTSITYYDATMVYRRSRADVDKGRCAKGMNHGVSI